MTILPPVATSPSTDELKVLLADRLDQLARERPDLEAALTLQRTLLHREIDLIEDIVRGGLPSVSLPPRYLAAKLNKGIPVLHGEPIPLPSRLLERSVRAFCDDLGGGHASGAARGVADALDTGALQAATLLSACFGRDQHVVRHMAATLSLAPDILWLVAELALAPFAHLLCAHTLVGATTRHEVLRAAFSGWDRGFCPACASWPAVVEAADGHTLRCSFCACAWQLSTYRCLYCGNDGETFVTAAPDPEQTGRRLQLCGECGSYVKVLAVQTASAFPLVSIDDLASMDLDLAAMDRKYIRPVLPEIRKR